MIIFKSQQYLFQWYRVIQVISSHYIELSLTNFVRKFDHEIIWNFCAIGLLYNTSAHKTFLDHLKCNFNNNFYNKYLSINYFLWQKGGSRPLPI